MHILLTGATGFIGRQIVRVLLQQGHSVIACSRHSEQLSMDIPQLTILSLDFSITCDWQVHLQNVDAVINCVGIITENKQQSFQQLHDIAPCALFEVAAQVGVKKIIQLSALGADEKATTPYHLSKKAADDYLRTLAVDWFVLQPSMVYGAGARSSALLHAIAALPVHLLPDGGKQLIQPICLDDVVTAVCCCLMHDTLSQQTIALVGTDAISYKTLLQGFRKRLGKSPALAVSIPYRYLLTMANLGKLLAEPIISKDNLAMLNHGNTADVAAIRTLLQREPESIHSLLQQPASQAECWHAALYFLKPVLALVIAFVWLWSGITSLLFYPHHASYQLLAQIGITGFAAPLVLYGLALMDIGLGIATLCSYRLPYLLILQMAVVLIYSVVIAMLLPEFLFHPFGALLKNLPFLMCLFIYQQLLGAST